jgi:hypothetical protein
MSEISEYNQRQYRLMLEQLTTFEQGQMKLDILVTNLEGLLNTLEQIEESWKSPFLSEWGKLEDARAVALFRQIKSFDQAATERILKAVSALKLLVLDKIEDPADLPRRPG